MHHVARYDAKALAAEGLKTPIRSSQLIRFWCHEARGCLNATVVVERDEQPQKASLRLSDDGTIDGIAMDRSNT